MNVKNAVCYSFDMDREDAMAHLRLIGPLRESGINIINGIKNNQIVTDCISEGDLVIIQREFPWKFDEYSEIVKIAHKEGKPVVYDMDDLLFCLPENHPNRVALDYSYALMPMFQAMMEADLVSVSTPKLRDFVANYNNNVAVLPNLLDDNIWRLNPPVHSKSEPEVLTIGYMGGHSHLPDLESISPVILDLIKRYPQYIRFHFWGLQPPDEIASLNQVKWSSENIYNYKDFAAFFQTQSADIFISPLTDNIFNRCKSPVKFFEYSALGVPGVYSCLETYMEVITHGHNGLLASSLVEWENCLIQLIEDGELRFLIAKNAQKTIKSKWLLTKNAFLWKKILQSTLVSKPININRNYIGMLDTLKFINPQLVGKINLTELTNKQTVDALTLKVAQEEQSVQSLSARVVEKEALLVQKEQSVQSLSQEQSAKLGEIFGSRAWRLIQLLWRARTVLIPHGSMRERLARRLFKVIRSVRSGSKSISSPQIAGTKAQISPPVDQPTFETGAGPENASMYVEEYQKMLRSTQPSLMDYEYIPLSETVVLPEVPPVKVIAFYLPQYHPIPENDAWWGKGFTEWTNVSKSIPQFVGHYQPHLPGELGFYDLRVPDVLRRQIELARKYGIYGFCFYYYWFNGKRLLEKPLEQYLVDPEINFPFCICWANENWTRRWDGQENDILIEQVHSHESDIQFIKDLEPVLRHPNYIRINGRPLIIVYRTSLMMDPVKTAATWRKYCKEQNLGNPYLIAAQTFGFEDPRPVKFDAAVEFPPHNISVPEITKGMRILNPDFSGKIYSYIDLVNKISTFNDRKPYKVFKTVAPSWDNAPRTPGRGHTFAFSTPDIYERWLEWASRDTIQKNDPDERFVYVNAWNEWGEGTHLEPDRKYGYAYLQATADALQAVSVEEDLKDVELLPDQFSPDKVIKRHDTAVILHIYYPELWEEIEPFLDNLENNFDLFVSIPANVKFTPERILRKYPTSYIYSCENRGRDIAPFINILPLIMELGYSSGLKLHTKKTVHREDGLQWLGDILAQLLGSKKSILAAKSALLDKTIGIVAPSGHVLPSSYYWGATNEAEANQSNVRKLAGMAGLQNGTGDFSFVAGSMYWFRPSALKMVCDANIELSYFEHEKGKKDGTFAHAVERFIGFAVLESGYQIIEVDLKGKLVHLSHGEINKRTNYPYAVATLNGRPLSGNEEP
jgi:lipopolysaccharide biosynthesis protein/glycosyltransferase involved in cell wall biosynthesis